MGYVCLHIGVCFSKMQQYFVPCMKITLFLHRIRQQVELESKPAYVLDQNKLIVQQRKGQELRKESLPVLLQLFT